MFLHPHLVEITGIDIHNRLSKNVLIMAQWHAQGQAWTSVFKVPEIYRKSWFCFSDCYRRSLARSKGAYSGGKTIDRETIWHYITIVENQWYNSLNEDYWLLSTSYLLAKQAKLHLRSVIIFSNKIKWIQEFFALFTDFRHCFLPPQEFWILKRPSSSCAI